MKEDIKVIVFDIYGVVIDKEGVLQNGVVDILENMKKKNFKLFLCSNTSRKMLEIWDTKYNFLKYFDEMILAEDVKANKPEPEVFKKIIDLSLGLLPQNILFIDDKDENVLASEAEGLIGLKFKDVQSLRPCLEDLYTKKED